jgi:uncharacterized membrane protein
MLVCILAYPILVHLSILFAQPVLAGLALFALYVSFIFKPLAERRPWAWASLTLAAVASAWPGQQDAALYALYLPPVFLPLALLVWWAPTLRSGRTPFVTRIATAISGSLPPAYSAYTRAVTWLWVWTFAVLALAAAGFALWAEPEAWSLLTNFLNPLLIGLVFAGEYIYRRLRFRHLEHPNFIEFIRLAAKASARPGA